MNAAEENELHVIVLDEFDAIARRRSENRGGNEGGTAVRDSVVNQLLALMDGVARLPVPTFVIALTNRRELIDPAVLRPGLCLPPCSYSPFPIPRGMPSLLLPMLTACASGRSGRLEVQVGVGRPDKDGRVAILRIHAEKMRASGRLSLGSPRAAATRPRGMRA